MKLSATLTLAALVSSVSALPWSAARPSRGAAHHAPCRTPTNALLDWIIGRTAAQTPLSQPLPHAHIIAAVHDATGDAGSVVAEGTDLGEVLVASTESLPPHLELAIASDAEQVEEDGRLLRLIGTKPYYSKNRHHLEDTTHHHRHHNHHHGHPGHRSFTHRLGSALSLLSHTEILALTFVLGAGLGSLLHILFIIVLVSFRYASGDNRTVQQRRNRLARAREGKIRLSEDEEVPPDYKEAAISEMAEKS